MKEALHFAEGLYFIVYLTIMINSTLRLVFSTLHSTQPYSGEIFSEFIFFHEKSKNIY